MRAEHRVLLGRLQEAKRTLQDLPTAEIPEAEVVVLLNTNPMYRDLQSRFTILEQLRKAHVAAVRRGQDQPPGFVRTKAELRIDEGATRRPWNRQSATRSAAPSASPWSKRSAAWKARWRSPPSRWRPSKKKSNAKPTRPTTWAAVRSRHKWRGPRSRTSNASCTAWPKSGNASAWNSSRQSRVKILGDPNSPAAVPENETRDLRFLFIIVGSLLAMVMPARGHRRVGSPQGTGQFRERRVETA